MGDSYTELLTIKCILYDPIHQAYLVESNQIRQCTHLLTFSGCVLNELYLAVREFFFCRNTRLGCDFFIFFTVVLKNR